MRKTLTSIPKVLLLGLDGAGKTTLLQHWLRGAHPAAAPAPTTGMNIQVPMFARFARPPQTVSTTHYVVWGKNTRTPPPPPPPRQLPHLASRPVRTVWPWLTAAAGADGAGAGVVELARRHKT